MLNVTIRMGADTDAVTVNGETFDRTGFDKKQRAVMAEMVRDTWAEAHGVKLRPFKARRRRKTTG